MLVQICAGLSEVLNAEPTGAIGNIDAFWITPANDTIRDFMIVLNENGIYQFSIVDEMGCGLTEMVEVISYPTFQFQISHQDESCGDFSDGLISIDTIIGIGTYTASYNFNPAIEVSAFPFVFSELPADDYTIFLADENGCFLDTLVVIKTGPDNLLDLGPDLVISVGDSVLLDPSLNFIPASWHYEPSFLSDSILSGFISPAQTVLIQLNAADSLGCSATDDFLITVENNNEIYVPNIFSPNGDSNNDFFFIQSRDLLTINTFLIFDRWGNLVFERNNFTSNDSAAGWDGKMNGSEIMPGVYVYRIAYDIGDTILEKSGDLLLIR